jgi:hypothetical protein
MEISKKSQAPLQALMRRAWQCGIMMGHDRTRLGSPPLRAGKTTMMNTVLAFTLSAAILAGVPVYAEEQQTTQLRSRPLPPN